MEYTKTELLPYNEWCYKYIRQGIDSWLIIKKNDNGDWDARILARINDIKYYNDSVVSKELMEDNPEFVLEHLADRLIDDVKEGRIKVLRF